MARKAIDRSARTSLLKHDQVLDKGSLARFLNKRSEWFSWYGITGNDPNPIHTQIISMIVSEMEYRVLLEERQHDIAGQGRAIPILIELLDRSYTSTQILAARKLLDESRDVLSLRRIIDDIRENQYLLTREAYVSFDGTPYEVPEWTSVKSTTKDLGLEPKGLDEYLRSRERHNRFDKLAQIDPRKRSRFDRLHPLVFSVIETWIQDSGAHRLITLGNKYIAHAADAHSRRKQHATSLRFSEVERVQRMLVRVERVIFDLILYSGSWSDVVPCLSLGSFGTAWDGAKVIDSSTRMQESWDKLARIRNSWARGIDDELFRHISAKLA